MAKKRSSAAAAAQGIPPLSEQLREIIRKLPGSRRALCLAAEVDPSQLLRFLNGAGRITDTTLDRLGKVLCLRLVAEA